MNIFLKLLVIILIIFLNSCSKKEEKISMIQEKELRLQMIDAYKEGVKALEEGDALLYKGCELFHWREQYKGKKQYNMFLFYVDKDGPFTEFKFDKRNKLGEEFKPYPKKAYFGPER